MNPTPIKLLIADDNLSMCKILRDYFQNIGSISVCGIATNGTDALELIRLHQPDVILLDLIMPHPDGLSILEQLNAEPPSRRPSIIVTTVLNSETVIRRTLELGASYYLIKPYHLEYLLDRSLLLTHPERIFTEPPHIDVDLNSTVTRHLISVGMSTHIIGYRYCLQAIELLLAQSAYCPLMKYVYPAIADKNGTTVPCVESAIRKAIATVRNPEFNTLSNRTFLSRMTEQIRLKYHLTNAN